MTLKNKLSTASISFLLTGSILTINAIPANATPIEDIYEPTINTAEFEVQTLTVSSVAVDVPIQRDSYSATSQAEIDALRAAEAEAARKAAEEQAAADAAAREEEARQNGSSGPNVPVNNSGVVPGQVIPADGIIAAAQSWVGVVPYGNGNHPSDSFACDGYVQYVFAQNGISLPRGADSQARRGTVIPISEAKAGDLIWWPGQHIGIYDGNGGYYHSPNWGRYVEHASKITWGNPVIVRL
jgi:cell wall-associated NlpC family hydrolase